MELSNQDINDVFHRLDEKGFERAAIVNTIDDGEYVCAGCGCSDSCACIGGCYWVDVDYKSGFGICSNPECVELLKSYNKGE